MDANYAAQRRELLIRAQRDFKGFCRHLVRIKNKAGKTVALELNPAQQLLADHLVQCMVERRPVRVIILKARQMGMSTVIQAYLAWIAFLRPGTGCLVVAHEDEAAGELFGKLEMIYEELPDFIRQPLEDCQDKGQRGKQIAFGKPHRSAVRVDSGQKLSLGRSFTFQHCHLSELPSWKDARVSCGALFQAVPPIEETWDTSIIIESTAEGMGDFFHETWLKAEAGRSEFTPIFAPWFLMPNYARDPKPSDRPLSKSERAFMREYGVNKRQMMFRRDKIAETDEDTFKQEYPSNAKEAFLFAGKNFVNVKALGDISEKIWLPKRDEYGGRILRDVPLMGNFAKRAGVKGAIFEEDSDGDLWIWEKPQRNPHEPANLTLHGRYCIGADVASGKAADFSAAHVLRIYPDHLDQVASFFGKLDPEDFGTFLYRLATAFNDAMVGIEINGGWGESAQRRLIRRHKYTKLYRRVNHNKIKNPSQLANDYGWHTNTATRRPMLDELAGAIKAGTINVRCPRTLTELENFIMNVKRDQPEANPGATDDGVMALGIGRAISHQAVPKGKARQAANKRGASSVTGY